MTRLKVERLHIHRQAYSRKMRHTWLLHYISFIKFYFENIWRVLWVLLKNEKNIVKNKEKSTHEKFYEFNKYYWSQYRASKVNILIKCHSIWNTHWIFSRKPTFLAGKNKEHIQCVHPYPSSPHAHWTLLL